MVRVVELFYNCLGFIKNALLDLQKMSCGFRSSMEQHVSMRLDIIIAIFIYLCPDN